MFKIKIKITKRNSSSLLNSINALVISGKFEKLYLSRSSSWLLNPINGLVISGNFEKLNR